MYFTQYPFCTSLLTTVLFSRPLLPGILVYFSDLLTFKYVNLILWLNDLHILKILTVMWMKNKLWNRQLKVCEIYWEKAKFYHFDESKIRNFFINHGSQYSKKILASPVELLALNSWFSSSIKKSLKWGQCFSVLKIGSCWSELTELFPGRWSPKYLHISLMV